MSAGRVPRCRLAADMGEQAGELHFVDPAHRVVQIAVIQVVYSTTEWDPVQQITFMTALPEFRLAVVDSQFAVFRNQTGSLAIINQDGTVNKIANPAKVGSGSFTLQWAINDRFAESA